MRLAYRIAGLVSVALGVVGMFLPLLPTVPFVLLAAFCFARSNPAWEQRLLDHPRLGPHIRAWGETGSISRRGKLAAIAAFAFSGALGLLLLGGAWRFVPGGVGLIGSAWILARPTARL